MNYGDEYKITIEAKAPKTSGKATKPSVTGTTKANPRIASPKMRATQEGSIDSSKGFQMAASLLKGGSSSAISALSKASPYIAASLIALKVAYQAADVATDLISTYTGDYSQKIELANFRTGVRNVLNPVQTGIRIAKANAEIYRTNVKQSLNRELMGASDLGGEGILKL